MRRSQPTEWDAFTVDLVRTTARAALLVFRPSGEEKWVPLSVLEADSRDRVEESEWGEEGIEVEVARWFCEQEGLR